MTAEAAGTSVRASVTVDAPIAHAFSVFTEGIGNWWPSSHHIVDGVVEMVFEARAGGRVYDRLADGTASRWARVLVYDPPNRVVFSWSRGRCWGSRRAVGCDTGCQGARESRESRAALATRRGCQHRSGPVNQLAVRERGLWNNAGRGGPKLRPA